MYHGLVGNKLNQHAKALSKIGASKGGKARASVLTSEERKEIARNAVKTRWAKAKGVPVEEIGQVSSVAKVPEEITPSTPSIPISQFPGTLTMGTIDFSCHVLDNRKRVIVQTAVVKALTGTASGDLKSYLSAPEISKYLNLEDVAKRTIDFKIPGNPRQAKGYEATLLVEICDAYLKAREKGDLTTKQFRLAKQAEIIIRASAKVGIIALIDEATGYQKIRAENALRLKLQAFIAEDMQEWAKQFPDAFFFELARLENIHYSPRNRPLRWGKYIMAFVYRAIDKDVAKELKSRTPNPHRGQNLHQWLQTYGKEQLTAQIYQVLGIMKTCKNMEEFRNKFKAVFQKGPFEQLAFFDLSETLPS